MYFLLNVNYNHVINQTSSGLAICSLVMVFTYVGMSENWDRHNSGFFKSREAIPTSPFASPLPSTIAAYVYIVYYIKTIMLFNLRYSSSIGKVNNWKIVIWSILHLSHIVSYSDDLGWSNYVYTSFKSILLYMHIW